MSFVSYAQNFEDVMLWRALKHVQNGVYVDVGAQHPVVDSVSKAFYEHGWRGIHIEPVPAYAELLRKDRPDEMVLEVALADDEGVLELNIIPNTGLSTAVDEYAQLHRIERGYLPQRIQVPVLTLKTATKSLMGKDVHWLKIDVEGLEEKVLKGWDSQDLRPWIMVVEATIPNSPETDYASWEPILTAAEYQFVYFDGLNRFYVAKEHAELIEAFSCPPNVFDLTMLSGLASSDLCRGLIASHQESEKELAVQAEKLTSERNVIKEYNTRLEAHAQWLQDGWDAANQRIEELSRSIGQLEAALNSTNIEYNTRLQAHAQWVQDVEATNARVQTHAQWVQNKLDDAEATNARIQAHAQWLQDKLDEANVKIHELDQSSHYWWTVADRLNQEQQSIYTSTFWRITWPLRKTMQIAKWSLALPVRIMKWAIRLLKPMIRPLAIWFMSKILNNPNIKDPALNILSKYPELKQHLRLFAIRSGLIAGDVASTIGVGSDSQKAVKTAYSPNMQEQPINHLSPRAARIYHHLKKAVEAGGES
jgi:FkbM family methyltransferase